MTLEEISAIFDEINWKHTYKKEDDVIVSIGGNSTSNIMLFTRLSEDGEMFDMSGRIINDEGEQLSTKESKHIAPLMAYLLLRNYETKFGTWEFSKESGIVSYAVEIPLEDNKLTAKQLKRITSMMNSSGDEADNIKHILEHGSLPLDGDEAAKKIAELEAMLAQLQGSGI